ncbi:hypothetical protein M413DRAFT_13941 [Hebeloma cylindrosporum]|uniref:Uncharacterized protein n=1 Tax=Hebeloma cylindrosporum TaxID=76867 RepID=A0A0C2XEQ6_HEBCY|nr:hypothetical protein M413DRAFT_13941 [Hebeloma cylindrosporum h7]
MEEKRFDAGECKISCLPPELLAVIFILARAEPKEQHPASFSKIPFEILVSHVSRHWRAVSLATLALWNQIDISTPRSLSRASSYLERSGSQCPLDIYINISKWEQSSGRHHHPLFIQSIANEIIPHPSRIRRLFLECFQQSTFHETLAILVSAPTYANSRSKGLSSSQYGRPDAEPSSSKIYGDMSISYPMLFDILTAPDCLLYFSISGEIDTSTWPLHDAAPDLQLCHLKALKISASGEMAAHLLLSLSAPTLQSLWLRSIDWFQGFNIFSESPQISSASPRFPHLQYLTLEGFNPPSIFSTFPSITHLHLLYHGTFAYSNLKTTLSGEWASLHTLVFSFFGPEASYKKIGDVISSCFRKRVSHGRPINNLLVASDVLRIIERKIWTGIPLETTPQAVSGENYKEPWWNQEEWPNWIRQTCRE